MADFWESLFSDSGSFLCLSSVNEESASVAVVETTLLKLECYLNALNTIINTLGEESRVYLYPKARNFRGYKISWISEIVLDL